MRLCVGDRQLGPHDADHEFFKRVITVRFRNLGKEVPPPEEVDISHDIDNKGPFGVGVSFVGKLVRVCRPGELQCGSSHLIGGGGWCEAALLSAGCAAIEPCNPHGGHPGTSAS